MLKIIVADDEKRICMLIRKLNDWQSLGFAIVGEAYDGVSAYEMAMREQADIVITDIRMPGMDGLMLARKLRSMEKRPHVILISGHKDFEYAHTAIKYGVENYLVKPISKDELTENLLRIQERILREDGRSREEDMMRRSLNSSMDKVRGQFMRALMQGDQALSNKTLNELCEGYYLRFQPGRFRMMVLRPDPKGALEREQVQMILSRLRDQLAGALGAQGAIIEAVTTERSVVACLNQPEGVDVGQELGALFERMCLSYYAFCQLTLGLSEEGSAPDARGYDQAVQAVRSRLTLGAGKVIEYVPVPEGAPGLIDKAWMGDFSYMLENRDAAGLRNLFSRLCVPGGRQAPDPRIAYAQMERLALTLSGDVRGQQAAPGFDRAAYEAALDGAASLEDLIGAACECIAGRVEAGLEQTAQQDTRYIREAKAYVIKHYAENITLEQVAQYVHMNASYFSSLFKRNQGVSFIDYLTGYRIERAKALLGDTRMGVAEVGERVGYRDQKYFSKLFLRVVGVKPSEYRRLYG